MSMKNTSESYGSVARTLHWIISPLVIILLIVGFFMGDIPDDGIKYFTYNMHKLTGLLVLIVMLVRTYWVLTNPKPKLPEGTPQWERIAELSVHGLFYLLLIAMPLSGWLMSTAAGKLPYIGSFQIAFPWITKSKALAGFMHDTHEYIAWILVALVSVHVLAALKHHFIDKDNVLKRML